MKPKFRHLRSLAIASSALLCISYAHGQSLYWDSNSTTAGAGATPTGTWGVDSFWNTDSTGGAGTFSTATTIRNDVFFSAGTDAVNPYSVSLNSATQLARLVTFEDGTATLNSGTLSLGNNGGITVTTGTVTGATISSNLTLSGAQTFNVAAGRTLTLGTGTFTRNAGATLNVLSTGTVTTTMLGLASASLVNGIIGPWASFGTGASTRYATIDGSNNIVAYTGGTAAATAANVTSTLGTVNYDVAAVGTLGAGANINTLRYTGAAGTIAGALTTNGIMNVGGGALVFSGAMTSGTGEMVIHAANGNLTFSGGLNNNGNRVTITGPSNVIINAGAISGGGGLTMNGSGLLNLRIVTPSYTGTTVINNGTVMIENNSKSAGNFTLNGGMLTDYYRATTIFTLGLGAGNNQIQIYGDSGFGAGNGGSAWRIGAADSLLVWGASGEGAATGFFNPTTLKFLAPGVDNLASLYGQVSLDNRIDLNGAVRTISVAPGSGATPLNATATLTRVISGTGGGGINLTGGGHLVLSNTGNTYSGTTTITSGTLSAANTGSLGNSSATNTLIFNGGTLRATGTVTSPSTRAVTMTQTGIFDTNSQAISIAGNIGGAGGLTKNGAGTLTLSGTNGYLGNTTVNAGTLSVGASANLGNSASNLILNGGTLQITGTTLNDFTDLGRTVSFTSGQTVGMDIADASNVFTADQVLNQGTGGLTKSGAGTLVINSAHTYTGVTTISAGTLRLDSGGSLASAGVINNSIYLINQNATTGTAPLTNIIGSGSIAAGSSATITINSATGLSSNALNTTGAGSFALSGVTTPTFGGLVGTTGNLSSSFSSGYSGVTHLTLNTNGNSFTYGGVIADGAVGMDLTKTGAGTQTLTGTNTYTGDTFLNGGTISLSGTAGTLSGTSGLTFNGGGLTLTSADTTAEDDFDRVNDSAPITSNGGTITYTTTTAASTKVFIETLGTVALTSGQLNLVNTLDKSAGSQTLALSGLTRTGATNSSVITFSNAGGLNLTNDRIRVNGITTDTAAGEIIGAWATVGTAANSQTDFAVYDSDGTNGFVVARNIGASAESTWSGSHAATSNYTMSAIDSGTISGGGRNLNSLRSLNNSITVTASNANITVTGHTLAVGDLVTFSATTMPTELAAGTPYYVVSTAANTIQVSATKGGVAITPTTAGNTVVAAGGIQVSSGNNLGTFGILNASGTRLNILQDGGAGSVTLPTATAGNLYLTTHGVSTGTTGEHVGITVTAPINDNGVNALTLVKSGVGVLQLNATSNYSGGTVLNGGTLWAQTDASLGNVNGDITFNGSATLLLSPNSGASALSFTLPSTRSIIVNNGAMATIAGGRANAAITINGDISGDGGVTVGRVSLLSNGGIGSPYAFSLLGSNTFTGAFNIGTGAETSGGGGSTWGVTINSLADSTSPITLNYGQSGASFNLGSGASANLSVPNRPVNLLNSNITINNLSGTRTMTLGAVSTSTAGAKTLNLSAGGAGGIISGNITDGVGTIGILKTAGTWKLSGTNTYSGQTSFSGIGAELNLVGSQAASPNTTFLMNTSASSASSTIRFLDNTGGVNDSTATFGGRYKLSSNNTPGVTNNFFVGNDSTANGGIGSGTTTGSTMIIGTMDWLSVASGTTNVGNIAIQGANGYRLQIDNVIMFNGSGHTAGNTNNTRFIPTTANVTLGNVTMAAGNAVNGVIPFLVLDGTSSDNRITGTISNASDVGTSLRPVNLTKSSTSTWTLSGTNTYSGATTVSAGTLVGIGANAFGSTSGISIAAASTATLSLRGDTSTNFVKASDSSLYAVTTTANGATINVDQATIAGTGAKTMTIGTLGINAAITNGTNFTGANNTSLSIGAVTTGASASGVETLTNSITGGGSLTLASIAVNRTGTPTLAFAGNGNTTVTGEISQVATTALTKSGSGTLTLNGSNTYTGVTTVNAGTLQFAKQLSLYNNTPGSWTAANINVKSGATFAVNVDSAGTNGFDTANLNVLLTNISVAGSATAGLQTGATLGFDTSTATAGTFTQGNLIANSTGANGGAIGLTKLGTGSLVLDKANTYTGTTNVNAGTLLVNNMTGSGTGTNTVSVASGATLGGTGAITGAINVSGVLSPGASIETLGTGTLSLTNGSSLVHELNSGVATAVGSDLLVVTGNLNLTGTVGLTLSDLTTPNVAFNVNDVFSIINYTGTWNGGLFTFGGNELANAEEFSFGLNTWRINYNAPTGGLNFAGEHVAGSFVNLTVIPEPNVAALIGAFGAILLLRRRR